jgi:hypothetical protein
VDTVAFIAGLMALAIASTLLFGLCQYYWLKRTRVEKAL